MHVVPHTITSSSLSKAEAYLCSEQDFSTPYNFTKSDVKFNMSDSVVRILLK
jgi:hypothetical protein